MVFSFAIASLWRLNILEAFGLAGAAILFESAVFRPANARSIFLTLLTAFNAICAGHAVCRLHLELLGVEWPVHLLLASAACWAGAALPIAGVLLPVRGGAQSLRDWRTASLPLGAATIAAAAGVRWLSAAPLWYVPFILLFLLGGVELIARGAAKALRRQASRTRDLSDLHLRAMEALAIAIEKDQASYVHLRRLRIYCTGIGRELGLSERELDELEAAAILHDVGKLAIPDYINGDPEKLRTEDREKVETHPLVSEQIVRLGYTSDAVPAIVRAHHERWNGTGYPDRLAGTAIPVGARILAVADAVDLMLGNESDTPGDLVSDAIKAVAARAGQDFDPRVVRALQSRGIELENEVRLLTRRLSEPTVFAPAIGAARSEMNALYALHEKLTGTLSMADVAHVLRTGFRDVIGYDALAVYLDPNPDSKPALVCGERSLMRRRRPVLTVPLPLPDSEPGRISVYAMLADRLTPDVIRTLRGLLPRLAQSIANARRYDATTQSATTDFLTGLPNAQSMFVRLRSELETAEGAHSELILLVCDLDGFKRVNDTLGHLTGNRVLQEVSQELLQATRGADYIARMGGDEFVLILPGGLNAKLDDRIAEFRSRIREAGNRVCGSAMIDGSFGSAVYPRDGHDSDELIAVADQRMYEQKARQKKKRTRLSYEVPGTAAAQVSPASHLS